MKHFPIARSFAALAFALTATASLAGYAGAECGDPGCAKNAQACEQAKEAGGCGCAGKAAAEAAAAGAPAAEAAAAEAPAGAGLRAHIDPATGELTAPPAGGAAAGAQMANRAAGQANVVAVPGGGVQAELPDGYRAEMKASVGADGKVESHCNHAGAEAK